MTLNNHSEIILPNELDTLIKKFNQMVIIYSFTTSISSHVTFTIERMNQNLEQNGMAPLTDLEIGLMLLMASPLVNIQYETKEAAESKLPLKDVDLFSLKNLEKEESLEYILVFSLNDNDLQEHLLVSDLVFNKKRKRGTSKRVQRTLQQLIQQRQEQFQNYVKDYYKRHASTDWINAALQKVPINPMEIVMNETVYCEPENILSLLKKEKFYNEQIAYVHKVPTKTADYLPLSLELPSILQNALKTNFSIELQKLYSHQTLALEAILKEEKNVIVSTSTASGKSLIFNIPILYRLLKQDPQATIFLLFPTKALAQDQTAKLRTLLEACDLPPFVYTFDGDTPIERREEIRKQARIILTNPDMLHCSILPYHYQWKDFLKKCHFVILDELHIYSGHFGSHFGLIMRRLRRLLEFYKTKTQFIACSATLSNPKEHFELLLNFKPEEVVSVENDGAPAASKDFVIWVPEQSGLNDAAELVLFFSRYQLKSVCFAKVRKACELVMKSIHKKIQTKPEYRHMKNEIQSYRGGYQAQLRRDIESKLFKGQLKAVIATNALELGVDIGDLDVTLHLGFPFSKASLWQQAGRAGRRKTHSIVVYLADADPLDFYYAKNPDLLFSKTFEKATCDWPSLLGLHLQCAALEIRVHSIHDHKWFPVKDFDQECHKSLISVGNNEFYPKDFFLPNPARLIPLRNSENEEFEIINSSTGELIEHLSYRQALFSVYEGAIYFHLGNSYLVIHADYEKKKALLVKKDVSYITKQRDFTNVDALETLNVLELNENKDVVNYGKIKVQSEVFGYFKMDPIKKRILEKVDVFSQPFVFHTNGFWIDVPLKAKQAIRESGLDIEAGVHAACHLLLSLLPSVVLCSAYDMNTEHKSDLQSRKRPDRLIFYNEQPSSGVGKIAYSRAGELIRVALEWIQNCKCHEGCPKCILSSQCSEYNDKCCKKAAELIFYHLSLNH